MTFRKQVVETILRYDGACPTHRKEEYVDLLTRGGQESKQMAKDMLRMSSCALTLRGLWWQLGIRHRRIESPYQIGMAVRDVREIAASFGAVMDGTQINKMPQNWDGDNPYVDPYWPKEGDTYFVLLATSQKGVHVGTITNILRKEEDLLCFESVDGGQDNGGIKKVVREFARRGKWFTDKKSGKILYQWFDADKFVPAA